MPKGGKKGGKGKKNVEGDNSTPRPNEDAPNSDDKPVE